MTEIIYRTTVVSPDLEVRSGGDGRTIAGIAVPYNVAVRINEDLTEEFVPGAFAHQVKDPARIKLAREHLKMGGALIGRATMLREDKAGLYAELRVAETDAGDETLALVKDGALDELSIGFIDRQNRRRNDGVIQRVRADLREVAVTLAGAYGQDAKVLAVRQEDQRTNMERAKQIIASLPTLSPPA